MRGWYTLLGTNMPAADLPANVLPGAQHDLCAPGGRMGQQVARVKQEGWAVGDSRTGPQVLWVKGEGEVRAESGLDERKTVG